MPEALGLGFEGHHQPGQTRKDRGALAHVRAYVKDDIRLLNQFRIEGFLQTAALVMAKSPGIDLVIEAQIQENVFYQILQLSWSQTNDVFVPRERAVPEVGYPIVVLKLRKPLSPDRRWCLANSSRVETLCGWVASAACTQIQNAA